MKYLFIVQGEGRGHLTQAMSLERMLEKNGHSVVGILVGKSKSRKLPDFFLNGVHAPVEQFESVNFLTSSTARKPNMVKSVLYNTFAFFKYFPSIRFLYKKISSSGADVVVNFYELLTGMTYMFHRISIPNVCIGHQYLFKHKDFGLPHTKTPLAAGLMFFTNITGWGADKYLALSFRDFGSDLHHKIVTVPPLLRPEVLSLRQQEGAVERGQYILGYMLNSGFSEDVLKWHKDNPNISLRFFWDRWNEEKIKKIDDTLSFYLIDDKEFLRQMAKCGAYASTAGFESVCEAIYLGKPVLMVPSHIEQEINAFDAMRIGAGVSADEFDLTKLLEFASTYRQVDGFVDWVLSAEKRILYELEHPKDF